MRRFCKRGLPVVLFVMITFFYPLLAPTAHRIDRTHFEYITNGMTRDQVESIFGVPPGQYDWAQLDSQILDGTPLLPHEGQLFTWMSRHGLFLVWFDQQDHVVFTGKGEYVRIVPPWQRWWRSWTK